MAVYDHNGNLIQGDNGQTVGLDTTAPGGSGSFGFNRQVAQFNITPYTPTGAGGTYDPTQSNQDAEAERALAAHLAGISAGTTPGVAGAAFNKNLASTMSMQGGRASAANPTNAGAARRALGYTDQRIAGQGSALDAQLRAKEQIGAGNEAAGVLGQIRGGDAQSALAAQQLARQNQAFTANMGATEQMQQNADRYDLETGSPALDLGAPVAGAIGGIGSAAVAYGTGQQANPGAVGHGVSGQGLMDYSNSSAANPSDSSGLGSTDNAGTPSGAAAHGGLILHPTMALVGEDGPELRIPLAHHLESMRQFLESGRA